MAENSKIEWTHHTFNPWRGCTKVSPGCAACYAETLSYRNPKTLGVWGPKGTRVVAAEAAWREPLKWDRKAKEAGERHRVFCASLADVFEDWTGPMVDSNAKRMQVGPDGKWFVWEEEITGKDAEGLDWVTMQYVRDRLFRLIDATPNLDWLILTKRPENFAKMMPRTPCIWCNRQGDAVHVFMGECKKCDNRGWLTAMPRNVWLGVSVEDQKRKERIDVLRTVPAAIRFLSCEPLIEDLDTLDLAGISWVIVGGESVHGARSCDIEWIRSIVRQCRQSEVACFVKQLGSNPYTSELWDVIPNARKVYKTEDYQNDPAVRDEAVQTLGMMLENSHVHLRDRKGGDPSEWAEDLRVREFPKGDQP